MSDYTAIYNKTHGQSEAFVLYDENSNFKSAT